MPLKQRRPKIRRELNHAQIAHLRWGWDFFGSNYSDDDAMAEDWFENVERIQEYAAGDPLRAHWPIYAALRFDEGMNHRDALEAVRESKHAH